MLVSESKKNKKTQKTKRKKKTNTSDGPYVISWVVYKIDRFLGNYRKALWLLFKMQFFISLQKVNFHFPSNLQSTNNVHVWK